MEKPNADNTTSDGKLGIKLENLFYSKNSTRHFERNQKLLDKDSSSYGNMKSIALTNEESMLLTLTAKVVNNKKGRK